MCWSGEASAVLTSFGFAGAYFEFRKMRRANEVITDTHGLRGICIFYFSLMELLQAVNYTVLDTPGYLNALFSKLGFLHITFQPFFITFCCLSLIPKQRRAYWFKYAILFSSISAFSFLTRFIIHPSLPGCFGSHCEPVKHSLDLFNPLIYLTKTCGCSKTAFISYPGDWHIAWQWVLNNCAFTEYFYIFTSFILPLFFGAYRAVIGYTLCGPVLAIFLTSNPNEVGAIWCLFSIAIISFLKIPIIERFVTVKHVSFKASFKNESVTSMMNKA